MVAVETTAGSELLREEVERIVQSEEFRNSEVLRRLLVYLAEKAASGEADNVKEYVVAIEGLGKPPSYDPQQNSAVRIQVGRLRQKLAEYYRNEGINDPLIVDLPKGRFRLVCEPRKVPPEPIQASVVPPELPLPDTENPAHAAVGRPYRTLWVIAATAVLSVATGFAIRGLVVKPTVVAPSVSMSQWTQEIDTLWGSFVNSKRPLLVL